MIKLNLGCGQNLETGYVNVDKYSAFNPDVVCDLEAFPWPFESNSIDEVRMHHVLEHMGATSEAFFAIMKELYRVCKPGAVVQINVPHPRSDGFINDPTHVRIITADLMTVFSKTLNREWKEGGWSNTPLAIYIDVDFDVTAVAIQLTPRWFEKHQSGQLSEDDLKFAVETYFNVVSEVNITLCVNK